MHSCLNFLHSAISLHNQISDWILCTTDLQKGFLLILSNLIPFLPRCAWNRILDTIYETYVQNKYPYKIQKMYTPSIRWILLAAGIGVSHSIAFSPWPDRNHQSSPSCRRVKICCWILSLYELCSLHADSWKKRNKCLNKINRRIFDLNFLVYQKMFMRN